MRIEFENLKSHKCYKAERLMNSDVDWRSLTRVRQFRNGSAPTFLQCNFQRCDDDSSPMSSVGQF